MEEQETSLKAQEEEVMSKRQELTDLKNQENQLEESVASMRKRIDQLSLTQQDTQLHISQVGLQELMATFLSIRVLFAVM